MRCRLDRITAQGPAVCLLALVVGGGPWCHAQASNPPGSTLRAPWVDRARDLGLAPPAGIRVLTDVDPSEARRLLERMVEIRNLYTDWFGPLELRRPDAPKLLVFEQPGEMGFTLRTALGATAPPTVAHAHQHPDGTVLAVTTGVDSPLSAQRVFQAEALRQYLLPRVPRNFPAWAELGLAEFMGAVLFSASGPEPGHQPVLLVDRLRSARAEGRLIPLPRLLRLGMDELDENGGSVDSALVRAQGWALVRFLAGGGSPELARRFRVWLAKAAAGEEPVLAFERVFAEGEEGVDLGTFERSWLDWLLTLEPSPVLAGLERAELLSILLDGLEQDGLRVGTPEAFESLVVSRPEIAHLLTRHPRERALRSHDRSLVGAAGLAFEPVRTRPRIRNEAGVDSPDRILLTDTGAWSIGIEWTWVPDTGRWMPRVVAERRR